MKDYLKRRILKFVRFSSLGVFLHNCLKLPRPRPTEYFLGNVWVALNVDDENCSPGVEKQTKWDNFHVHIPFLINQTSRTIQTKKLDA